MLGSDFLEYAVIFMGPDDPVLLRHLLMQRNAGCAIVSGCDIVARQLLLHDGIVRTMSAYVKEKVDPVVKKLQPTVAQWVKEHRTRLKLSARGLADRLKEGSDVKVEEQTIRGYEYDRRHPAPDILRRMEELFGEKAPQNSAKEPAVAMTTHHIDQEALRTFLNAAIAAMSSIGYAGLEKMGINLGDLMDTIRGQMTEGKREAHHWVEEIFTKKDDKKRQEVLLALRHLGGSHKRSTKEAR